MKKKLQNSPVGIFDSGIGGLTVLKEIRKVLPNEDLIYFGDTARVPYGIKSVATIQKYAIQDVNFLLKKDVKLIVVACNTVSSNAMDILRTKFKNIPFVDVLIPNALYASQITNNLKIGVIGTPATIGSGSYRKVLKRFNPKIKVFSKMTPLLVPLAEEGFLKGEITRLVLKNYLGGLINKNIDTLILGCTHYPLFEKEISKICGKKISIVNSALQTARTVKNILEDNDIENRKETFGNIKIYLSDIPVNFSKTVYKFLKLDLKNGIEKVDIEKY
ncbi:MAG: glutamate racemase [bacterium]|uniref:Glutamate racemase n=2 Tax=Bacteria candidate phyla TaxID=1783234 RepID=A0A101I0I1_UNCT6|nr:MAG: Glutamate racemase [candidate division TA06 bacterium 32_111]KUK86777.1 MAG: Glutamate racemase [candidate division TA06 bacterium 34_109]MDI6700253.1 glutamate racemase [bacterium]HAF08313.1 glutamate racemase [candidate division WOR-3 bacterium]HCP16567.1 glutamate racemase [candidate division WOR-3 bacterium]